MKKFFMFMMSAIFALTAFGSCGLYNGNTTDSSDDSSSDSSQSSIKKMTMTAHYDYGMHIEDKITVLLNSSNVFFKLADYGIEKLLAGDVVTVEYTGECYIQETYPSTVVTKDMDIQNVTVLEAKVLELSVGMSDDGITLNYGNNTVFNNAKYVINEDGTFETLGEQHVGTTLYGTDSPTASSFQIMALYTYAPRIPLKAIPDEHVHSLVCLEEISPTCQSEGRVVIGCTYGDYIYEERVLEKVACQLDEKGKCIWCEPQLSNFYTWINDLTAEDITQMQRDVITYGVAPGERVDGRMTTTAQEDKETILAYLKNLSLKAVPKEEAQVDGGGGVRLYIETADGIYGMQTNNSYILINDVYYLLNEKIPFFGENAAIWESCCFCGSFDCAGHE